MLKKCLPDLYLASAYHLPISLLKEKGVKVLMCDVDNTLLPHDEKTMSLQLQMLIQQLKQENIQVVFVSNNTKKRLEELTNESGMETYSFACKPFPFVFMKIKKKHHLKDEELAVMGDQLFTDILGGNMQGAFTILCEPLQKRDIFYTRPMRWVEKSVFRYFHRKGYMTKGDYYETM